MLGRLFGKKGGKSFLRRVFSLDRVLGFALLVALLAVYRVDPYPLQLLRAKIFDQYQRIKPREFLPPVDKIKGIKDLRVAIIDIDEPSLAELGQWPWPRSTVARMVANLFQMGVLVVGFDVVFAEPDRMSPQSVAEDLYGLDDEIKEKLKELPGNDKLFADVIKQTRVVLGQATYWEVEETGSVGPPVKKSIAFKGPKPDIFVPEFRTMVRNIEEIEKVAAGHGLFSLLPEPDGIVRRVPLIMQHEGKYYPTLSVEMMRVVFQRPTILVDANQLGVKSIGVRKGLILPTDNRGRVWPYFSKSDEDKYVSAREVLAGTADPKKLKGKMALVGTSAVGLLDIRATPTEEVIPGVEVHAQLIESAVTNQFLSRPGYIAGAEFLFILGVGLMLIWLVPWVGAKWTLLLFVGAAGGIGGTSWHMFVNERILLDPSYGIASAMFLYMLLTYTGYAREEAERRQVRSAFGHYLAPAMVEKLAEDPDQLKLGGETRNMSMLFCDVRGFTTISEQFDAEGLTKLINKLLTPLTGVILDRQGTVDKYMGDCIMAFWNAPLDDENHARHACLSSLEMFSKMGPLNDKLEQEAIAEGRKHIPLKIGTGINSGDVVVGNMGSDQRFDYSILGDEVNLASRLEGQCKTYAVDIVIGENTHAQATDLASLELDLIKVKGKTEAVRIFTLQGDDQVAQSDGFKALKSEHDGMLAAYRAQDWAAAKARLQAARGLIGDFNLAPFYDVYEERIAQYEADPPGAEWDGVFVATSK